MRWSLPLIATNYGQGITVSHRQTVGLSYRQMKKEKQSNGERIYDNANETV